MPGEAFSRAAGVLLLLTAPAEQRQQEKKAQQQRPGAFSPHPKPSFLISGSILSCFIFVCNLADKNVRKTLYFSGNPPAKACLPRSGKHATIETGIQPFQGRKKRRKDRYERTRVLSLHSLQKP